MSEWNRLFIVAEGEIGLTVEQINSWLKGLAGHAVYRFKLSDEDLDSVRYGSTVAKHCIFPVSELSSTFRLFLLTDADRISAGLRISPWMVKDGTEQITEPETGTIMNVPVMKRRGTHVDLLFRTNEVSVKNLESALISILYPDIVVRSDGTSANAAKSPIGLKLIPSSEVRTPSATYPSYTSPEIIVVDDQFFYPEEGGL